VPGICSLLLMVPAFAPGQIASSAEPVAPDGLPSGRVWGCAGYLVIEALVSPFAAGS